MLSDKVPLVLDVGGGVLAVVGLGGDLFLAQVRVAARAAPGEIDEE